MENNITSNTHIYCDRLNQYLPNDEIESKSHHKNESTVFIDILPLDMYKYIFTFLRTIDLPRASLTNKKWNVMANHELQRRINEIEKKEEDSLFIKFFQNNLYHTCIDYFFRFSLDYYHFDHKINGIADSKDPLEHLTLYTWVNKTFRNEKKFDLIKKIHMQQERYLPLIFEQAQITNDLLLIFKTICYFPKMRHLFNSQIFPKIENFFPVINLNEEKEQANHLKIWVRHTSDATFLIEKCITYFQFYSSSKTKSYLDLYFNYCLGVKESDKIIELKKVIGSLHEIDFPEKFKNFSGFIKPYISNIMLSLINDLKNERKDRVADALKNIYKIYSNELIDEDLLVSPQISKKISLLFEFYSSSLIDLLDPHEMEFYINFIQINPIKFTEFKNQFEDIENVDEYNINLNQKEIQNNLIEILQKKNTPNEQSSSEDELDRLQDQDDLEFEEEFSEDENVSDIE